MLHAGVTQCVGEFDAGAGVLVDERRLAQQVEPERGVGEGRGAAQTDAQYPGCGAGAGQPDLLQGQREARVPVARGCQRVRRTGAPEHDDRVVHPPRLQCVSAGDEVGVGLGVASRGQVHLAAGVAVVEPQRAGGGRFDRDPVEYLTVVPEGGHQSAPLDHQPPRRRGELLGSQFQRERVVPDRCLE